MAELRNWQPGYLDRFKYGIAGLLGDDRQAVRNAEKITGLLEYAPGVGDAMAGAEAVDAFNEGSYGTAGLLGAAAVAGLVPGVGDAVQKGVKKGIRAYHGSPHDFDKFSLDKIGTGEGAQAYGHGLYFAEAEDVARGYRDNVSRARGQDMPNIDGVKDDGAKRLIAMSVRQGESLETLATALRYRLDNAERGADIFAGGMRWDKQTVKKALKAIEAGKAQVGKPGRMYEVNINADPDDFLDWDKPLSEQPENVRQAFERKAALDRTNFDSSATGDELWKELTGSARNSRLFDKSGKPIAGGIPQETARQFAIDAGIPGIKYLDAGSRGAGDGSRNYVVFDDALIEILRKYGIAGLGLLGAGGAAYNAENDGPAPLL